MATVSGTFTATGNSSILPVYNVGDDVTVALSGTYAATVELQRDVGGQASWETVASFSTANATVSHVHNVDRKNEKFRLKCTYTSGTVTYSISDADQVIDEFKDAHGNVLFTVTDAGLEIPGNLTVTGNSAVTGTQTVTGAATTAAAPVTTGNLGTAGTGVTAVEQGDAINHVTKLTLSVTDAFDIADAASLADGYLVYTFPAGNILVKNAWMSIGVTTAESVSQTDTPDVGVGTVIGTGAVAVLGGTATFEDIITGQTAADANGTATVAAAAPALSIATAAAHTVHVNIADAWADDTGADLTTDLSGTLILEWTYLD